MTAVALQTRVTHLSHEGVLAQTLCKNLRVLYSTFHAQCQGAQTAQTKPRLHRTGDCAVGDAVVTHRLVQLLIRGQSHTQQNIRVARKELRSGVNHHVSTQIQRTLQNRGCEGVIHRGHNTQAASSRKQGRQVSHLKHRVRGAFQPRQDLRCRVVHVLRGDAGAGCGILHSGDNALGVFNVHANELNDAAALQILAQGHRRHVCVLRNQNNGANRHQVDHSSDSSHTGGEQQTGLGSVLQLCHNLFHALPSGVREAGVHAVLLNIDGVHTAVGGRKNDRRVHRRIMLVCRAAARDDEGLCGVIHVVVICTHVFKPGTPWHRTHVRAGDRGEDLHVFYL